MRKLGPGVILLGVMVALLVAFYPHWQPWAAYETGSRNTPGTPPNYNFWSGFGSVFPWSMGILGTLAVVAYHSLRRHNCHAKGCLRIGRYPVAGTPYTTCRKHHPHIGGSPTAEDIVREHIENCDQH